MNEALPHYADCRCSFATRAGEIYVFYPPGGGRHPDCPIHSDPEDWVELGTWPEGPTRCSECQKILSPVKPRWLVRLGNEILYMHDACAQGSADLQAEADKLRINWSGFTGEETQ